MAVMPFKTMIYFITSIMVLIFAIFAHKCKNLSLKIGQTRILLLDKNDCSKHGLFLVPIFVLLLFITGLRNNMGTDYIIYEYNYKNIIKNASFKDLIVGREAIFSWIQKIIGEISEYNIVVLMTVLAFITIFMLFSFFKSNSDMVWLSCFLLVTVGSYYTCFNTTRNYLAAAIFVYSCKYIYKRDFLRFALFVALISQIHMSAVVLILLYWILPINFYSKKMFVPLLCCIWLMIEILKNAKKIVYFVATNIFYDNYAVSGITEHIGVVSIVRPLFFTLLILIFWKMFDLSDIKQRCWINGTFLFLIVQIFSLQFYILYRYTYFFIPFSLVALPHIISSQKSKWNKYILILLLIIFCFGYCFIGQFTYKYSFFWQPNVMYFQ